MNNLTYSEYLELSFDKQMKLANTKEGRRFFYMWARGIINQTKDNNKIYWRSSDRVNSFEARQYLKKQKYNRGIE